MADEPTLDLEKLTDELVKRFVPPTVNLISDPANYDLKGGRLWHAAIKSKDEPRALQLSEQLTPHVFPGPLKADNVDLIKLHDKKGVANEEMRAHIDALLLPLKVDVALNRALLLRSLQKKSPQSEDDVKSCYIQLAVTAANYQSLTAAIKLQHIIPPESIHGAWEASQPTSGVQFRQYT